MFTKSMIAIAAGIVITSGITHEASAQSRISESTLAYEQIMMNRARGAGSSADLHAKAMGDQSASAGTALARQRTAARKPARAHASIAPTYFLSSDEILFQRAKRQAYNY